ncbi:hypothetical protein PoB_005029000 [Plakobranchus ocellatus]|uniref:Uncharacterized protein n=1 Tax=Plakobranchus ocellatus TaxID=259542 RepID=A0AAV4BTL1_9GAST|nr:hypothetical protein PoB_005029000 [Plakobranchus ocellatus]
MFIIPAIQQSAFGLEDDSLLGTMHLNALNGSSDVLGSSGASINCFRGPMTSGTASPPAISSSALSTPGCNDLGSRGRNQRRTEVFGGLFGASISDNHPYRPQDSGTASLFREDASKTQTAAAVVSAGLATAGTTQFVSSNALAANMSKAVDSSLSIATGTTENKSRSNGDNGDCPQDMQTVHRSCHSLISDNCTNNESVISHDGKSCRSKIWNEGQYLRSYSSCPSPPFSSTITYENDPMLKSSELAFLARETERKRRGKKHSGPRRHSLDLDLALISASSTTSSRKDHKESRAKSAYQGRNSIPSDLDLSLRTSRSACRCHHGDGDNVEEADALAISITEVNICTDTLSTSPSCGRKSREIADGAADKRPTHAQRKHRRAYTTDSATSVRAMKLLEKVKDRKSSNHESSNIKGGKYQHNKLETPYHNLCGEEAENMSYHRHHAHKNGHHSRPGSGLRHFMSRHLSDNTAQQRSQMTSTERAASGDADSKRGKAKGKLLSHFSLE